MTLNTLVQAAWLRLLAAITGQRTVAFGAVMSGRSVEMPGIDHVTGLLVGVLPLVCEVKDDGRDNTREDDGWLRGLFDANIEALRQSERAALSFRDAGNRGRMSWPLTSVAALADRLATELGRFAGDRTAMWDVPQ